MGIRRTPVAEVLQERGVDGVAFQAARAHALKEGVPMHEAVRNTAAIEPLRLAHALSDLSGLPVMEKIDPEIIDPELIRPVPMNVCRDNGLLPLYVADDQLIVGIADLSSVRALDDVRVLVGKPIRPVLVPVDVLFEATTKAYDRALRTAHEVLDDVEKGEDDLGNEGDLLLDDADLLDDPNEAPIIRFVNALLTQAIKERASDIHIEPFEKELAVRYRVDGVLYNTVKPPVRLKNSIVSRIKIMAGLNIAERRLPQDGRIRRRFGGREIDLRVSTVPVRHGERVVMRILEKGEVYDLNTIGMEDEVLDIWKKLIQKPHGILLVSGPTGSGKSSTLFSSLQIINSPDKNILTIEDPIEYEVKGIGQVQVNPKIELTFASALRAFLRQDPDVILVGEIRDRETAANAVQASLTGHLVFSTIHTNDAAGAFARLCDMGVEPFLVASSLLGVIAQRLVRRLCPECRESYVPSDIELEDIGIDRHQLQGGRVWRPKGCAVCNKYGYKGRIGIFEFLPASEDVKAAILRTADAGAIKAAAAKQGMRSLREDGIRKALKGVTSFDEVLRVTRDDNVEM